VGECGSAANHGSVWEALPAMEFLLNHFEDLKSQYEHNDYMQSEDAGHDQMTVEARKHFAEAINNG
jgi:hypothetical protein